MIEVRPFAGLGGENHGWLDAHHHFSFADYRDTGRMGWGRLRVWNDDTIAPQSGFPPHPHRDMEIVTYVRKGAITHQDSLGNRGRTAAGDVQVMSAGSGIVHAEYNLEDEETTLFQIWILPDARGGEPGWGARPFPREERDGRFVTLASGIEGDDALPIRADARVLGTTLKIGQSATLATALGRHTYLVAATGRIRVEDGKSAAVEAAARDGVAITGAETIIVTALEDSEIVAVDAV